VVEELYEDFSIVMVLAKGNTFNYVVPSFPVFNADIVELKLQWEEICKDGSTKLHVFMGLPGTARTWITHFLAWYALNLVTIVPA